MSAGRPHITRMTSKNRAGLLPDDFGKGEQLRANFQMGLRGRGDIDLKAQPILFLRQIDNAPALRESLCFAHRQGARTLGAGKYLSDLFLFRGSDENHLAGARILIRIESPHFQRMAPCCPAPQTLFNLSFKGVVSRHADVKGRALTGEGVRGPLDELGKVIEEGQLHPVLAVGFGLSAHRQAKEQGKKPHPNPGETAPHPAWTGREVLANPARRNLVAVISSSFDHATSKMVGEFQSEIPPVLEDDRFPV
jgi:hypothetical protein